MAHRNAAVIDEMDVYLCWFLVLLIVMLFQVLHFYFYLSPACYSIETSLYVCRYVNAIWCRFTVRRLFLFRLFCIASTVLYVSVSNFVYFTKLITMWLFMDMCVMLVKCELFGCHNRKIYCVFDYPAECALIFEPVEGHGACLTMAKNYFLHC